MFRFLWRFLLRLCFPPPIIWLHFPTTNWMKAIQNLKSMYVHIIQEVKRVSDFSRATAWQCYSNIQLFGRMPSTQKFVKDVLSVFILHPKWLGFHGVKLCHPPNMFDKIKIIHSNWAKFVEFSCENEMNIPSKLVHKN